MRLLARAHAAASLVRAGSPRCQEREWPNLGGERVVRKPKAALPTDTKPSAATDVDSLGEFSGRRLVLGLLVSATAVSVNQLAGNLPRLNANGDATTSYERSLDFEGDAVSVPFLETRLSEVLTTSGGVNGAEVEELVALLERREGSQYFASSGRGRWVLPWVGGWERIYASDADASFVGGPPRPSLKLATGYPPPPPSP